MNDRRTTKANPTGKGGRDGNEACRVEEEEERGGQGRWDRQRTTNGGAGWRAPCRRIQRSGLGRPFLVVPFRAPRTLESEERFPEAGGVPCCCFPSQAAAAAVLVLVLPAVLVAPSCRRGGRRACRRASGRGGVVVGAIPQPQPQSDVPCCV